MDGRTANYTVSHKVKLNRNSMNKELCEYVNLLFDLSEGKVVVLAAGDDIFSRDHQVEFRYFFDIQTFIP
jgi:hypothetical protein